MYMYVCVCVRMLSDFSPVSLFVTLWTAAHQALVYGVLQARIFLIQGSNLRLMSPALAGGFFTAGTAWEAHAGIIKSLCRTVQISSL